MKQGDPQVFLRHILDSIEAIERYSKSVSKEDFLQNEEKQDAILRKIEIIGEAVRHLPKEFKDLHQNIPWQEVSGTRDKLIHDYFGVDLELVWEIIKKDLMPLKDQIRELMSSW